MSVPANRCAYEAFTPNADFFNCGEREAWLNSDEHCCRDPELEARYECEEADHAFDGGEWSRGFEPTEKCEHRFGRCAS